MMWAKTSIRSIHTSKALLNWYLKDIAEAGESAVVIVRHLTKAKHDKAIYRGGDGRFLESFRDLVRDARRLSSSSRLSAASFLVCLICCFVLAASASSVGTALRLPQKR